jgi:hypothetical protein
MSRHEQYQILLQRSFECEMLSEVMVDISIRKKCADLAVEYRKLANEMKQLAHIEQQVA